VPLAADFAELLARAGIEEPEAYLMWSAPDGCSNALSWPDWPDLPANVGALATTRRGGVSAAPFDDGGRRRPEPRPAREGRSGAVRENRARLQALLPGRPAWIAQVHGADVVDAAWSSPARRCRPATPASRVDPGVVCAILTADCLPVLFADLEGKVVGAAHAGWRGLAAGVLAATVARCARQGAGEITAWLGPAIGPYQFEVTEPSKSGRRASTWRTYAAGARLLARRRDARAWRRRCTPPAGSIPIRRDGVTGRQASLIWIK
jgi:copper oxidase (laccase) domain-containing protein